MTMMATDIGIASRRKVISSRCVRVRKTSRRDEGETCSEGAREFHTNFERRVARELVEARLAFDFGRLLDPAKP